MSTTHNSIYCKNPVFLPRRLQRDWVFIPLEEPLSTYKELLVVDEMGKFLYDLCDGNHGVEQIVERVVKRFDISAEVANRDVGYFLAFLGQKRILLLTTESVPQLVDLSKWVNELKILQRLPISVSFEITGKCDLRCIHCYVAGERPRRELKTAQLILIINKLCEAGCLMLHLTGGECTIRKDFVDVYLYAKQKGLLITISTNATAFTHGIVQEMAKYPPRRVSVSLYGAEASTYESITQKKGSFRSFVSGIELLRSYGIPLELKAVLLKENVSGLGSMKAFAAKYGCQFRIYTGIVPGIYGELEPLSHQISDDDLRRVAEHSVNIRAPYKTAIEYARESEDELFACNAGNTYFHIDCTGQMHLCLLERAHGYSLLEGNVQEGWAELESVRRTTLRMPDACKGCTVIEFCHICPPIANLVGKSRNSHAFIAQFCRLARLKAQINTCPVE